MIRGIYKKIMLGIMVVLGTSSMGVSVFEPLIYDVDIVAHIKTGKELTNGIKVNVNSVVFDHLTVDIFEFMNGGTSKIIEINNAIQLTDGNGQGLTKGSRISFQIEGDVNKKGYLMKAGGTVKEAIDGTSLGIENQLMMDIRGALRKVDSSKSETLNISYGVSSWTDAGGHVTADGSTELICYSNGNEIEIDMSSVIITPKLSTIINANKIDENTEYTNDSKLIIKVATP